MSALARSQDLSSAPASAEAPALEALDLSGGAGNAAMATALDAPPDDDTPTLDALRGVRVVGATPPPPSTSSTSELDGDGDLIVGTSTDADSAALDNHSYTQRLLELQQQHPELSIDELMRMVNAENVNGTGSAIGETAGAADSEATTGKKVGVFIGNSQYDTMGNLPGAATDAAAMASTWGGQGYEARELANLGGEALKGAFNDGATNLGDGDELILYYAGHGLSEGLLGVDYQPGTTTGLAPMAAVSGAARAAESAGVKTRLIVDACESGALVEGMVAEDAAAPAAPELTPAEAPPPLESAPAI